MGEFRTLMEYIQNVNWKFSRLKFGYLQKKNCNSILNVNGAIPNVNRDILLVNYGINIKCKLESLEFVIGFFAVNFEGKCRIIRCK